MVYQVFFLESHCPIYKSPFFYHKPGLIMRQSWNFCAFFIMMAFGGVLKAILIKEGDPLLLELNEEVMTSGKPVILGVLDESSYESLKTSPYQVDRWIYHNAKSVYFYTK
jgi:hypothetical protein